MDDFAIKTISWIHLDEQPHRNLRQIIQQYSAVSWCQDPSLGSENGKEVKKKRQYIHRIFTNGVNNVEWIPSIFFTSNMAHVHQTQVVAHIIWMILCFLK